MISFMGRADETFASKILGQNSIYFCHSGKPPVGGASRIRFWAGPSTSLGASQNDEFKYDY